MDHPYQKLPLRMGQCRFCPEIHPKFSDLIRHEATHRLPKEDPQPEVTRQPVINEETDNVRIMQTPIEPLRDSNVQMDESPEAGVVGESSHTPSGSKNFGANLADSTMSDNSQMDFDAEIKERIRNYDWTKDFQKISTTDGKVAYKCKICSYSRVGLSKSHLLPHTFVHSGEQPFQCHICSKRFKYSQDRNKHQIIIHGERPYKCSKCSSDFKYPSHLSLHMKSHLSNMQKNVKANKIVTHVKDVVTKDVIICLDRVDKEHAHLYSQALKRLNSSLKEIQDKAVKKTVKTRRIFGPKLPIRRKTLEEKKRRVNLKARKSTNSGNSQVDPEAEIIKERIRNYDWAKDFIKIYSEDGKITYKCKICPFRRKEKWQLLHHTFIHTGELLYQCSHCPKKFNQLNNKRVHENIHTGNRSYKCSN